MSERNRCGIKDAAPKADFQLQVNELTDNSLPEKWLPVGKEILRYLAKHPGARDTSGGIINWWLRACQVQWKQAEMERILEAMVAKGWLLETRAGASPRLYGLNKDRIEEIQAFLESAET